MTLLIGLSPFKGRASVPWEGFRGLLSIILAEKETPSDGSGKLGFFLPLPQLVLFFKFPVKAASPVTMCIARR